LKVGVSVKIPIVETCANCKFWEPVEGNIPFKCTKHGIKFFTPGFNPCYSFEAREDKQDV